MPNALPLAPAGGPGTKVVSGARCAFYFNGDVIGYASGVSVSEDIRMEPVEVLNRLAVAEHVPVGYNVSLSCSVFRTVSPNQVSNNVSSPGSLKQQNIFPRYDQILRVEGCDAVLYDELAKKMLAKFEQVKCTSHGFSAGARSLLLENVSFVAIKVYDESEVSGLVVST